MRIFFLLLCLSLTNFSAIAQEKNIFFVGSPFWLRLAEGKSISVSIKDAVTGGCWTNSKQAKNAVSLEFKRDGFVISDAPESGVFVLLEATGFRSGASECVVNAELSLIVTDTDSWWVDDYFLGGNLTKILWERSAVTINFGPDELKGMFVDFSQELLLDISKNKRVIVDRIIENAKTEDAKKFWKNYSLR